MTKSPARLAADLLALQVTGESVVTTALLVSFDPTGTGLAATSLQAAVEELKTLRDTLDSTVDTQASTLSTLSDTVTAVSNVANSKARVYVQAGEPATPAAGDLWVAP